MKTILLVEDNKALGWLIVKMLGLSYRVELKQNALNGLTWLMEGHRCDVIITDINMPELSGLEFLESCNESGLYSSVPIIILSGNTDINPNDLPKQVMQIIAKPFNPKDLLNAIEFALDRSTESLAI